MSGLYNPRTGGALGSGMSDSPFSEKTKLPQGMDLDGVANFTGMDFTIAESPDLMIDPNGLLRAVPGRKILYRTDTMVPLANVGKDYKLLQPLDLLGFYKDLIDAAGYEMASAGVIHNGRRFWAMAKTGHEGGLKDDPLNGYLFLGTAVDGSLATTGFFTELAMRCWNQAPVIIKQAQQDKTFIKVPHSREFDVELVRSELGTAAESFSHFIVNAQQMSERKITQEEALRYFVRVFKPSEIMEADFTEIEDDKVIEVGDNKRIQTVMELFNGKGKAMDIPVRKGTAWGAYNAVTEYLDHHSGARNAENRFHSAVLGEGFRVKQRALEAGLILAA